MNEQGVNERLSTELNKHMDNDTGLLQNVTIINLSVKKSPVAAKKRVRYNRDPSTVTKPSGLYYDVQDNPPIHLATMFGFQIAMANIFSCVNVAVLMAQFICADQQFAASLYTTTCVMSGLCTILQTSLGVRIPVFQGPSIMFTIPYVNAASDAAWGCRGLPGTELNSSIVGNDTTLSQGEQPWMTQWNKIQGSLMLASCLQIVIGFLGLGGLLVRLMGPISITCLILLFGIFIQGFVTAVGEIHWGMSCLNILIIIILTQYVNKCMVPIPTWSRKNGMQFQPCPLFELFPVGWLGLLYMQTKFKVDPGSSFGEVIISVIIGWFISYILTVCGVFPDDPTEISYQARTDFGLDAIRDAPIVSIPYPGQYGAPSFTVSYTVVMTVVVLASILESIGVYIQTTGPSRVPNPPPHSVNRGILVEGIGSLLSGAMGAGHATTSYSNMIGMIGITKIASRRVFNIAGLMMIVMGICGKLGALFVAIPKPVLAGPIFIAVALLVGSALSNLREVDLWSMRNQGILGIAIMAGIAFPFWIQKHPDVLDTGTKELDQSLTALLGMPFVVGVVVAMFLDVTVPGNSRIKDKPSIQIGEISDTVDSSRSQRVQTDISIYNLPFITNWLSQWRITRFIPFLPNPSTVNQYQLKSVSS